jgi:5-formyltetrahydrofolate cyclo-ligase
LSRSNARLEQAKRQWRLKIRGRLKSLSEEAKETGSARARRLLVSQKFWLAARSVLCYAPLEDELSFWPLLDLALAGGKQVTLPRYDSKRDCYIACAIRDSSDDTRPGKYGIREPRRDSPEVPINRLDLALVPGVGFDLLGFRLGRGRGYYDRLLGQRPGFVCGVAFDEQIVDELPVGIHDRQMDCILTPSRCLTFKQRAVLE